MREFKRVSNRHLLHQEVELGDLLKSIKVDKQGYNGKYYGVAKQGQLPICLDLTLGDNSRFAIPYSNIIEMAYDIEIGISIKSAVKAFQITGRKLDELYNYLKLFRISYINEHSGADIGDAGVFIGTIKVVDS